MLSHVALKQPVMLAQAWLLSMGRKAKASDAAERASNGK